MIKDKIAKIIRIISVPPVMITSLMVVLYILKKDIFRGAGDLVISILLLGIVPVTAYLLQKMIPGFRKDGRKGQRKLAFITTAVGYTAALVWGLLAKVSNGIMLVIFTYFFSVFILIFFNKIIHFKASGHASSFTGPLLILIFFIGWQAVVPCIAVAFLISWSSVYLKRHTWKELIGGFLACFMSFCVSMLLTTQL